MNMVDLQLDFYRRFNESHTRMHFGCGNVLCTLLGHENIKGAKSLTCALSMGITLVGRRLGGGVIKLENTKSNICTLYRINNTAHTENVFTPEVWDIFRKSGFYGAEILCDSTVPYCYDDRIPLRIAIFRVLMNMCGRDMSDALAYSEMCAGGSDISVFRASFAAKKGWCTFMHEKEIENYPLPLTGYRILTVCTQKTRHSSYEKKALKELRSLRSLHPMVCGYDTITHDMLKKGKYPMLWHLCDEDRRVEKAASVLRACRLKAFAQIVRQSEDSIEKYLEPGQEEIYAAHQLNNTEGCLCARIHDNCITAIVEDPLTDYIIKRIDTSFESQFGYKAVFSISDSAGF